MVERGTEGGLAAEALTTHLAGGDLGRQDLDRDDVAQRAVAGSEHRTHAADAGETQDFVPFADRALYGIKGRRLHSAENVAALAVRRSGTDTPGAMPAVSCRVLGPVRITVAGADAPAELLWRKHVALLVYLARSPRRSRTREHLVGLLWSDRDEKQARHSLSEALRVLRRVLGDASVRADVDQVGLVPDAVSLDCDRFAELSGRGDWVGATALVDGEFLEGLAIPEASDFENWLGAERMLWRSRALEALERRAAAELDHGDAPAAAQTALRAVRLDTASEAAARTAMRALTLAGDRAGALHVAEELARALRATLGAEPSAETMRLAERIREARIGRRVIGAPATARARAPLVGRVAELAELIGRWRRAQTGRGQVVIVEGEPGEGKTRLLEELQARARLDDATVAATRAVPTDVATPWSALRGFLASGLADAPGITGAPPEALAALAQLDPDLGGRFRSAVPAMAPGDALGAAVRAIAAERPALLALDDAQWLDGPTLAILPALARDATSRPLLLLLGIARASPDAERFGDLRSRLGRDVEGAVIRLGRLDAGALLELVRWAFPRYGADDAARLTRRLEGDTAGIPLLAVAMLEAVARGLAPPSTPDAGVWPSPKRTLIDSLPGDLPPSVIGVICQRFRDLPEPAQYVLGAAAALGDRLSAGRLERATALGRTVVDEALDLLEWNRWLVADGRGYVFAAPIERAVLLQEMITPGQARRYRAAASA
jgi:DNA-binding SARP family transcriptional activator